MALVGASRRTPQCSTAQSNAHKPKVAVMQNRRTVLQGTLAAALQLAAAGACQARQEPLNKEVDAADSPYIQELLRRSQENKEQRDKERLAAYYKKNFKDYFEFEGGNARAGAARGISSETQQAIERWLENNQ